jgi:hypothetical protein
LIKEHHPPFSWIKVLSVNWIEASPGTTMEKYNRFSLGIAYLLKIKPMQLRNL